MRTNHRLFLVAAAATLAAQTSGWTQFEKVPKWEISEGAGTAAQLSAGGKNFIQELRIARPEPATTADQLAAINPHLPELLPGFAALMAGAEVSTRFKEIYELKLKPGGTLDSSSLYAQLPRDAGIDGIHIDDEGNVLSGWFLKNSDLPANIEEQDKEIESPSGRKRAPIASVERVKIKS